MKKESPKQQTQAPANSVFALCKRWFLSWWEMIFFGAIVLVLALSPSSYTRENTRQIAREIYASTWQVLAWFTVLWALLSLVLIRIVVVTALSYGLSQYALEMVVRVLVLELIPLSSALFVVLRSGMVNPQGTKFHESLPHARIDGVLQLDFLRNTIVPRVIAIAFSVLALAAVSSAVALLLAYSAVYGFSPWGLAEYTRMVGRVFDPVVILIFSFKTCFFSLAVAVIPLGFAVTQNGAASASLVPKGTVRLFLVLVLIEAASLAIKYF